MQKKWWKYIICCFKTAIEEGLPEKLNIWFSNKFQGTNLWRKPQPLSKTVNSIALQWQISVAESRLFISFKKTDGNWAKAISLDILNKDNSHQMCPNLSPDGKYLFYTSQQTGLGNTAFWVSAKIIEELKPKVL